MAKTITPYRQGVIDRFMEDHRRFKNIPGYFDGPIELGDWSELRRMSGDDTGPRSDPLPDSPGTIPVGIIPDGATREAISRIAMFTDDRDVDDQYRDDLNRIWRWFEQLPEEMQP